MLYEAEVKQVANYVNSKIDVRWITESIEQALLEAGLGLVVRALPEDFHGTNVRALAVKWTLSLIADPEGVGAKAVAFCESCEG